MPKHIHVWLHRAARARDATEQGRDPDGKFAAAASGKAHVASEKARASGAREDHEAASKAHQAAAKHYPPNHPDPEVVKKNIQHTTKARVHRDEALSLASGGRWRPKL